MVNVPEHPIEDFSFPHRPILAPHHNKEIPCGAMHRTAQMKIAPAKQ